MSTVYIPQTIETAEQAEALPIGTIATHSSGAGMDHAHKVGVSDALGIDLGWLALSAAVSDAAMIGWTALVRTDVEVEHIRESGGRRREKTLYITPWKDPR